MTKRAMWCLLFALPLFADVQKTVKEGVALYDAGRYDEAVAKFKAALEEDPTSLTAAYELGLTYSAKGDTVQCQSLLEPLAGKKSAMQSAMLAILGNCYDSGGDPKRAAAAYRKGLKVNPNDTQVLYNLAVTLAGQGDADEARALLKKELTLEPNHTSGHFLLARVFDAQNFRTAATMEYLRFLALEPSGDRAKEAAARVVALVGLGVEVKDEKNVNITIDPQSRKEEGDYGSMNMMMALAAAAQFTEENKDASEFEKTRQQVSLAVTFFTEAVKKQRDYTAKQNGPFFNDLVMKDHVGTFAGVALMSLKLPGTQEWLNANGAKIDEYVAFLRGRK